MGSSQEEQQPLCFYILQDKLLSLNDIDLDVLLDKYPSLKKESENKTQEELKDFILTKLGVNKVYNSGVSIVSFGV